MEEAKFMTNKFISDALIFISQENVRFMRKASAHFKISSKQNS